jgi:NAD(P)-dependent dehydrogenase (short-subunit alcohol dehydrogenase family)
LLGENGTDALRKVLDTNLYGVLATSRAFAPVLRANGGGALVNMLSALSWVSLGNSSAYSVSKAAAWSLTNGLRNELRGQGTQVVAVHAGYIDTDMVKNVDSPKARPEDIAKAVLDGIEAGATEVLADDTARHVKAGLGATPSIYLG